MLNETHRTILISKGPIVARVLLGFLFFYSGLRMLTVQGPAEIGNYFDTLGLPMAAATAWVVIILKIGAGGALMAGYRVVESAAALAVFTFLATLIAHFDISDTGLTKNLAIIGGLLFAIIQEMETNTMSTQHKQ